MKRSLIAVAALLLLLSSTTYANPPRPKPRPRFFLGSVLCWLGIVHHHGPAWMARHHQPAHRPPAFVHGRRPNPGRHKGWDRNGQRRGRPGNDKPHGGKPRGGRQRG